MVLREIDPLCMIEALRVRETGPRCEVLSMTGPLRQIEALRVRVTGPLRAIKPRCEIEALSVIEPSREIVVLRFA